MYEIVLYNNDKNVPPKYSYKVSSVDVFPYITTTCLPFKAHINNSMPIFVKNHMIKTEELPSGFYKGKCHTLSIEFNKKIFYLYFVEFFEKDSGYFYTDNEINSMFRENTIVLYSISLGIPPEIKRMREVAELIKTEPTIQVLKNKYQNVTTNIKIF